jgi:ABC-type transporter Mla MlaB component
MCPVFRKTKFLSNLANSGAKERVENTHRRGWISEAERDTLKQLWDNRTNVHQKKIQTDSELDLYTVEHVNAPYAALLNLLTKLKEWNGKDS